VAGLELVEAGEYPGATLRRMRYVGVDGFEADGVEAFARGLEHVNVGWALVGAGMRLPGVRWVLQVVGDGVGFGERGGTATCAPGVGAGILKG
jgi:hypothetical protein